MTKLVPVKRERGSKDSDVLPIARDELIASPRPIYLSSIILPYVTCTQDTSTNSTLGVSAVDGETAGGCNGGGFLFRVPQGAQPTLGTKAFSV